MKTFDPALAALYAERHTTIAHALRITRTDGQVFAYTSFHEPQVVHGITYTSTPGIDITQLSTAVGFAVSTINVTTLDDGTVFTFADLLSRVWEDAEYVLFRYDWANPPNGSPEEDIDIRSVGKIGVVTRRRNMIVAELRDLRQHLQHNVGEGSSKTCRNRLGDTRCAVDLIGSPNEFTAFGWVTTVINNQNWVDSNRTEAEAWYDDGEIIWTSGNNSGLQGQIKSYVVGSPPTPTFGLTLPLINNIQAGDAYVLTAGCRKRWQEDCIDKFNNGNRFGGEPHRPLIDELVQRIQVDV